MKKYFMKKKMVFPAAFRAAGMRSPAGGAAFWKRIFLLLLLLCLPLPAAADDGEAGMAPTDGDRILLGSIGEASNLIPYLTADSASHEVADLLYVAPLRFNKDLEPECWAAESFSMEDEGRLLRFRLRKGILWEDGTELTAEDVAFTYKLVIDPATGSPYADDFLQIKEFRVLDRYSFEVRYERFFARAVSSWMNPILPRHILEGQNIRATPFARKPVGAGPYRLRRWEPGVRIVLEASPTYFLGRPHISEVVFRIIPDTATMFMETRAGRLDVMELSPQQYLRQTSGKKWAESFHKYRYLASVYNFLGFNLEHPFFKDRRVRQAISCAINRGDIVKGVLLGLGEPAFGPYKPGTWAYHPGLRPVSFNPDRARKLLAEAGYENGVGFPETTYLYNTDDKHQAVAEALQSMWKNVLGVEVTLNNQDWNVFLETRTKGDYSICRNGWIADYNDPVSFLDMFMTDNGNNDAHYSNAEYDAIMTKVLSDSDAAGRMELMHQAEDLLVGEDQAIAPLYYYSQPYMVADDVHGMYYTPLGNFLFFHATKG